VSQSVQRAGSSAISLGNNAYIIHEETKLVNKPNSELSSPVIRSSKLLGSTAENPFVLVQDGSIISSFQPFNPFQVKFIESAINKNRKAILFEDGEDDSGTVASSSKGDGVRRRVVFNTKFNTSIEFKKKLRIQRLK
jgi:hypothetical protein